LVECLRHLWLRQFDLHHLISTIQAIALRIADQMKGRLSNLFDRGNACPPTLLLRRAGVTIRTAAATLVRVVLQCDYRDDRALRSLNLELRRGQCAALGVARSP
jgi:hypothetical protein